MKSGSHIVLIGLVIAAMATVSACTAITTPESATEAQQPPQSEQPPRVPNEYLVTLSPHVNENVITEYYGRFGIKYVHALEDEETYLLVLSNDPGPKQLEQLIQNESRIKAIQPNLIQWDYR